MDAVPHSCTYAKTRFGVFNSLSSTSALKSSFENCVGVLAPESRFSLRFVHAVATNGSWESSKTLKGTPAADQGKASVSTAALLRISFGVHGAWCISIHSASYCMAHGETFAEACFWFAYWRG